MRRSNRIYPYFQNNRFYNYLGEKQEGIIRSSFMLLESLLHKAYGLRRLKRNWLAAYSQPMLADLQTVHQSPHPLITWVGHSTFLIRMSGLTIITDPLFGNPSSLFRRMTRPGVALEQLPPIDIILISHNHLDHMHADSLKAIAAKNAKVKILVPLGDKAWFDKRGFGQVEEYSWWENSQVMSNSGLSLLFTFLPAHHWSGRGIFDRNKSLWGSWMIQSSEHNLYFAGDTAYGRHFKVIAAEFNQIDTAIMPIGPCEPHEDMKLTHMSAEQAGDAFVELGAQRFIPCHWGTLWFGTDYPLLPIERLQGWWKKNQLVIGENQLSLLKFGETIACERKQFVAQMLQVERLQRT